MGGVDSIELQHRAQVASLPGSLAAQATPRGQQRATRTDSWRQGPLTGQYGATAIDLPAGVRRSNIRRPSDQQIRSRIHERSTSGGRLQLNSVLFHCGLVCGIYAVLAANSWLFGVSDKSLTR